MRKFWLSLILLSTLAYANSWQNGFAFDDEYVLKENPHIRTLGSLPSLLTSSATQASYDMKTYRPLRQAAFTLLYPIFGQNPFGYHVLNTLLHTAGVAALFALLLLIGIAALPAFAVSALFALHPLNTEAVANITGMTDTMFLLLYLLSLCAHIKRMSLAAYACFILSLLSKEMAITFPLVAVMLDAYTGQLPRSFALAARRYAAYLGIAALYLALRSMALGELGSGEYYGDSFWVTIWSQCRVTLMYLKLSLVPWPLSARYDIMLIENPLDPGVIGVAALLLALLAATFRAAVGRRFPLWLFGLWWFALTIIPVLNIIPIRAAMMGERYMYLPLIGLLIALVSGSGPLWSRSPKAGAAALGIILAVFFIMTIQRNQLWHDDLTLFEDARTKAPDSLVVHWRLFKEYDKLGDTSRARVHYNEMKRINEKNARAYLKKARGYLDDGDIEAARRMAAKALTTKKDLSEAGEFLNSLDHK